MVGVVSEADLLRARRANRTAVRHVGRAGQSSDTAGQLMTSPAIAIGPDASLAAAARRMDEHHLRLLPVVDANGSLLGVVSRRNLLSIFLRTDKEIVSEVRGVLRNVLLLDDRSVTVSARSGVVTLSGRVNTEATRRAAVSLAHDVFAVWMLGGGGPLALPQRAKASNASRGRRRTLEV